MSDTSIAEAETPGLPWWLVLIEGIAAIILGLLLFMRPAATTIVVIQFLGIYWLITGLFTIISLLWDRTAWGWKLFSGILGIIAGLLIIQNPLWSTLLVPTTLAIILGVIGIMIGIFQLVDAFRGGGWGSGILGALSILLGFLLITRPVIAGLALPWMLGGLLVAGGILAIIAAFGLRSAEPQIEAAKAPAGSQAAAAPIGRAEPAASEAPAPAGAAGVAAAGVVSAEAASGRVAEDTGQVSGPAAVTGEGASVPTEDFTEEVAFAVVSEEDLTGNVNPSDPEEMAKFKHSLEYVEGIGPVHAGQLKEIGLISCLDLLKAGSSRKGREQIVEQSGISSKLILKWVNHVDLYRIKGIGSEYADLLEASGVDTVVELAQRNPLNLTNHMLEVNSEKNLVRKLPTLSQVEDWVSQAKELPRVVTY